MSFFRRSLRGASTIATMFVAAALAASPLVAQKTNFTVTGGTITFPAPTAADYINGFVNSTTGVTFTLNSGNGVNRTTTVSIRSASTDLGNGKVLGDLQWKRSDLATWNSITLVDSPIEQRIVVNKGLNDPWSNTVFFRMTLNWATDAPATYTANYVLTLSQTVP
ncbi:MAG TPA: hypothetical protein VE110_07935 [Gemmatimonadaceae bacterium]|nr:hypothetical protein [Gemmatimonadaceae bacterium]